LENNIFKNLFVKKMKQYEKRNKLIKWFTIFVILSFIATIVGSGIIAYISINSSENKVQSNQDK